MTANANARKKHGKMAAGKRNGARRFSRAQKRHHSRRQKVKFPTKRYRNPHGFLIDRLRDELTAKAVTKQGIERNRSQKRNTSSFGRNAPKLLPVDEKIAYTKAARHRQGGMKGKKREGKYKKKLEMRRRK